MTTDQATREDIIRYRMEERKIAEIAELTGVSERTVSRVLAEHAKNGDTPKYDPPTRTRASKETCQNLPKCPPESAKIDEPPKVTVMPSVSIRQVTQGRTKEEMMDLLESAKETLRRAKANNDGTPQATSAEVQATKAVKDIITEIGKWCGMERSVTDPDTKQVYTRADIDTMDRETMHRVVLQWTTRSR